MSAGGCVTRRRFVSGAGWTTAPAGMATLSGGCGTVSPPLRVQRSFDLPSPRLGGSVSFDEVLTDRRSRRRGVDRVGDLSAAVGGEGGYGRLGWAHHSFGGSAASVGAACAHGWRLLSLRASRPSARGACRSGPSLGGGRRRVGSAGGRGCAADARDQRWLRVDREEVPCARRYAQLEQATSHRTFCCRRSSEARRCSDRRVRRLTAGPNSASARRPCTALPSRRRISASVGMSPVGRALSTSVTTPL
jgi:hypothetical protein